MWQVIDSHLKKVPIVKLLFPYVLGIGFGLYFEVPFFLLLSVAILSFVTALFISLYAKRFNRQTRNYITYLFISGCFICVGLLNTQNHVQKLKVDQTLYGKERTYMGVIRSSGVEKRKTWQYELEVLQSTAQQEAARLFWGEKIMLYLEKQPAAKSLKSGDTIVFTYAIKPFKALRNPNTFNYASFLRTKGFAAQVYLSSDQYSLFPSKHATVSRLQLLRNYCAGVFDRYIKNQRSSGIVKALVLGDKEHIDRGVKHNYMVAGAMHVLAVSGLHVGLIFVLLSWVTAPLKRKAKLRFLAIGIVLIGIWLYALLTGAAPSVLRAATMFSFIAIGQSLNRSGGVFASLVISAFFLLIINPLLITAIGFQLSYTAVIGIVALQPGIYRQLYFKNLILNKIWQWTSVSIAAQIGTLPLTLFYFEQFPVYALIANLFVIPFASIILIGGLLLIASSILPPLATVVGHVLSGFVGLQNYLLASIALWPYAVLQGLKISIGVCIGAYIQMILWWISLKYRYRNLWLLATVTFILLVAVQLGMVHHKQHRHRIVIYELQKGSGCSFIHLGRANTYVNNEVDSAQIQYQIMPAVMELHASADSVNVLKETNQVFSFGSCRVLRLTQPSVPVAASHFEIIWVDGSMDKKVENTLINYKPKWIVYDSRKSSIDLEQFEKIGDLSIWNIAIKGAFVKDF